MQIDHLGILADQQPIFCRSHRALARPSSERSAEDVMPHRPPRIGEKGHLERRSKRSRTERARHLEAV